MGEASHRDVKAMKKMVRMLDTGKMVQNDTGDGAGGGAKRGATAELPSSSSSPPPPPSVPTPAPRAAAGRLPCPTAQVVGVPWLPDRLKGHLRQPHLQHPRRHLHRHRRFRLPCARLQRTPFFSEPFSVVKFVLGNGKLEKPIEVLPDQVTFLRLVSDGGEKIVLDWC
ncbi:hypothetical protein PIB30_030534 [Stylosanthes scabra]|uniref:Uncharacterized protein n=1 Tax=Stylosanthes scabra TaxID=79078 RepID=A0ABU6QBH1_9FABA|nr:hypothetical protein [Stylosanthes scabra]